MRWVTRDTPPFSPLDRVRVLLAFHSAGKGTVMDFYEDLMPKLEGMEPHTVMTVLARLLSEVSIVPAPSGATAAKPARYALTAPGVEVAARDALALAEESEMNRRLLARCGYAVPQLPPEPVVVAADFRRRKGTPGGDAT